MKRIARLAALAALHLAALTTAGCGGGGGGGTAAAPETTPRQVVLKLSSSETTTAPMAGLGVTVVLPAGVAPSLNADGSVAASTIAVSGAAAPGTALAPLYTPAGASSKATLQFALVTSKPEGFGAGEFATVALTGVAGAAPNDFSLKEFRPISLTGENLTGLTASLSVVQP